MIWMHVLENWMFIKGVYSEQCNVIEEQIIRFNMILCFVIIMFQVLFDCHYKPSTNYYRWIYDLRDSE